MGYAVNSLGGLLVLFFGDMRSWETSASWYKEHLCARGARISAVTHPRIAEKGGDIRKFDVGSFFGTFGACADKVILKGRNNFDMLAFEDQLRERLSKRNYTYRIVDRRNWVQKMLMLDAANHAVDAYERVLVIRTDITVHYKENIGGRQHLRLPKMKDYKFDPPSVCRPSEGLTRLLELPQKEWCLSDFTCVLTPATLKKIKSFMQAYGKHPTPFDGTDSRFYGSVIQMEANFARWRRQIELPDIRDSFVHNNFSAVALFYRTLKNLQPRCDCRHYLPTTEAPITCKGVSGIT